MKKINLSYAKSGVNIKAADKFVKYISSRTSKIKKNVKSKNIGGFGAISKIPNNLKNPYLVTSTDGVGTKLEIANNLKKFDTIGIDLVAMSVNDLIVQGAKPLLFLDYISISKIDLKKLQSILNGIIKGCMIADCELAGGETAEMPGTYTQGKFDLAGFAVGLVEKKNILKKEKIKNGNIVLGVPSSGLHSNGFSLIRNILKRKKIILSKNKFLKEELLRPTKIYVNEVLKLINKKLLISCANITGGGLRDNLSRIIPHGKTAEINLKNIKTFKIFKWLKKSGVSEQEMLKTFNCGIGFCLIVKKNKIKKIQKIFPKKFKPYIIGKIKNGKDKVVLNEKISW
tara:strand:+ start:382 stop:1407 length:1026 start_codon:yes stop_codon:yes gene_type:complete